MINENDVRRYTLYVMKKPLGGWMYSLEEIAQSEKVTRQAIWYSVKKFGDMGIQLRHSALVKQGGEKTKDKVTNLPCSTRTEERSK